ncbi:MAG: hypothetical protein WCG83_02270 [Candidatus Peregrinibacteria bacterium]
MKKFILFSALLFLCCGCASLPGDAWKTPFSLHTCIRLSYPYDDAIVGEQLEQFDREVAKAPQDNHFEITGTYEYCENRENSRGVFIAEVGKLGTGVFRYDRTSGVVQQARFLSGSLLSYIPPDESYFLNEPLRSAYDGKLKNGTEPYVTIFDRNTATTDGKITVIAYSRLLHRLRDETGYFPLLAENDHGGLCGSTIQSDCLVDLYYTYDYLQNHVWLEKACTFVLKPDGKKESLEACMVFPEPLK